ncbi:endonuclease-reverse transcriptase [Elysia marginata]|uniref:Endonuclease-reverse transcriptase n=1 Tax=Elysia marginata TaxID=1093978 RepID=A0AAV4FAC7_9GAST|nr:endonuclease-reverse transcriptase [Elysia marginata]
MHSLASSLQHVYSEFLLQEALAEKRGVSLNGENIANVRYADDTIIMAETPESLQQMLDSIAERCKANGMEMYAKKTKTIQIVKEKKKVSILIDRTPLE